MKKYLLALSFLFIASAASAVPDPDHTTDRSVTSFPVIVPAVDDFVIMTDTSNSGLFSKVTFANYKTALGVQDADADLTDLADGSLTGTKVGFADTDNLFTATNIQAAVEELNDSINDGNPNGTGAKVHWSQLLGVPAGFADGTDSEGIGGGYTNLTSFVDQTAWRVFYSNTSGDVTELALGADGTYLKSNGATSAPTWATPSGLTSQPTADNQLLQATGVGTYAWTSTLDGIGNITGAGTYNNITITQPATGATLTLVEGSTLATSGAYSITLTSTGATNVTLPTTGTLLGSGDLGSGVGTFLGTPSSANLASAVTDETGSGVVVFGTSPTIATPAITAAEVNGSVDDTLTAAEVSSTIVYNTGQSAADVALTLPTAASGYSAIFTVGTAQSNKWGVRAGTNDKIYMLAADGTVSAGSDNGYARMTAAQIGQSFACWTFKTDAYDWMCKAISIGTSTFAAN